MVCRFPFEAVSLGWPCGRWYVVVCGARVPRHFAGAIPKSGLVSPVAVSAVNAPPSFAGAKGMASY